MAVFLLVLSICAADPPAVIGWQPTPEGGREYLIQLAPETLDKLRQGYDVCGTLPLPGGGKASCRVTAQRGDRPRSDGEVTSARRVTTDEPIADAPSAGWATPATNRATSPATAGNRWDASAAATGVRRIEDMPDAASPSMAAATTSRWSDLPPLERSDSTQIGKTVRGNDQEYRPPGVGAPAGDALAPRPPFDAARPTSTVLPPPISTERSESPMRPLLPISDIDRGTARPLERSTGAAAATPSAPSGAGGATAPLGSAGATNRPPETTSMGNQPPVAASSADPTVPSSEAKPWGTLVFVGALLFASLGLNVFLGWTAWDYRRRCETLTIGQDR